MLHAVEELMAGYDPQVRAWIEYVETEVRSDSPPGFDEQRRRFDHIYAGRSFELGPPVAWVPELARSVGSNLFRFTTEQGIPGFDKLFQWSVNEKGSFWTAVVDRLGIPFSAPPKAVLGSADPLHPRWLEGASLDITRACFTGDKNDTAVISGGEQQTEPHRTTFGELEHLVDRVAHGVISMGLDAGAGVALYMPMTLECVAAYLGVVRAGHPVISIADSFAAEEVEKRFRLGNAGAVVTVDEFSRGGRTIELYTKVKAANAPPAVVIPRASKSRADLREGDILWDDFLGPGQPFAAVPGTPDSVTNILFSSGTTGDPKAIPWTQITPLKCAMDGHFHQDIRSGDVVAWPTNIGWMMGPWLIYAGLVNRAAIALYEGLPSGPGFARFIEKAGVTMLGVVPSLVRAWRESNACDGVDWSGIRVFSSTGEPSNGEDMLWLMSRTGFAAPMIEYCGGTEIGGAYITGSLAQPASPASFTTPALGLDLVILDGDGTTAPEGAEGEVFLVPPSIGLSERLLNRNHAEVYYDGCPPGPNDEVLRRHGDQLLRLPGGFFRAQGRADDTMNLGGIKVSSKELERALELHANVQEAAAVAVRPPTGGGDLLIVFVRLTDEEPVDGLRGELQAMLSSHLNPLFRINDLVVRDTLPRTASGKLMRRVLRNEYGGSGSRQRRQQ